MSNTIQKFTLGLLILTISIVLYVGTIVHKVDQQVDEISNILKQTTTETIKEVRDVVKERYEEDFTEVADSTINKLKRLTKWE